MRRLQLRLLARTHPQRLVALGEKRLLQAFHRTVALVSAYRTLLEELRVDPAAVRTIADFARLCPRLSKENTFLRFTLAELAVPGALDELAGVLTSSGHGGRFAFGLTTWSQARYNAAANDLALEQALAIDSKRTLLINCLPMGVRFQSKTVTIAETSVREDMAVALIDQFGPSYEQLLVVGDPLFLKRLTDHAEETGLQWGRCLTHVLVGEETFGENYRSYLAAQMGIDLDDPAGGFIASSMGVGELGLNLFFETRETMALRRLARKDPELFQALFGAEPARAALPMIFAYNPLRIFVEILDADAGGYGRLALSTTDLRSPLPLLRYQTGDVARRLDSAEVTRACARHGQAWHDATQLPLVAVSGREKDRLPNGLHLLHYKEAIYQDPRLARQISGAFRLEFSGPGLSVHVQLRRAAVVDASFAERFGAQLPQPAALRLWAFEDFPYGMNLDYERKFAYCPAGGASTTLAETS